MKRICPHCSKKFVLNKKERKQDIKSNFLPNNTENYCYPCISEIASIEYEIEQEFWAQGA